MNRTDQIGASINEDSKFRENKFDETHIAIKKVIASVGLKDAEVKKQINLDCPLGYKYFDGSNKIKRDSVIAILIICNYNVEQCNNFLKKNGYNTLYVRHKRDYYIYQAIKCNYSINELNDRLSANELERLF